MPLKSPCIKCSSTEDRKLCSKNCEARDRYAMAVQAGTPLESLTGVSGRVKMSEGQRTENTQERPQKGANAGGNTVYTMVEVAAIFGVTDTAVSLWRRRKNPMPLTADGGFNLDEIKIWVENEGLTRRKTGINSKKLQGQELIKENIIALDLKDYPEIERRLSELAEKMLLPVSHIIISLVGEGLARKS